MRIERQVEDFEGINYVIHAENYYKHCLSLPMFPGLTDEEQAYVIK